MAEIRRSSQENALKFEDQYYQQYVEILGAYAAAIRDDKITRERNQLMFTIASEELGRFVNRHAAVCLLYLNHSFPFSGPTRGERF